MKILEPRPRDIALNSLYGNSLCVSYCSQAGIELIDQAEYLTYSATHEFVIELAVISIKRTAF